MPKKIKKSTGFVDNPFKWLAHGLATDRNDIWEVEPVHIQEFIESKEYLGLKFNSKTGRGCRPKIMEIAIALADPAVREAVLLLGKGSGKDFISSILHLYGIYLCQCMYSPQAYYGLSPGSAIYFVNVARNEEQAKNVFFREFLGHLENCSWMEGKYLDPAKQSVQFDKNVVALSGNSQAFAWLGYNTIQWVGDEIAFFLEGKDEDTAASKAEECWEAAFGSCKTRFPDNYKMIGITTPRFDDDFVMKKFFELKRRMESDSDSYAVQAATWDIHPKLTKEDFKNELERDHRRTMRDYGAQPMGVIETFWGDPDFIDKNPCENCKMCPLYQERELLGEHDAKYACRGYELCRSNPYEGNGDFAEWFIPDLEAMYYMHFDLSKNKDKTGFAMAHVVDWIDVKIDPLEREEEISKTQQDNSLLDSNDLYEERPLIKVDFIGWVDPTDNEDLRLLKNGEIYYSELLRLVVFQLLQKGFNIVKLTCDSYASHMFKQTVEDRGIETELLSVDRTDEVPVTAKACFVENRVEYPWQYTLAREARHLKYIRGNKVDHPTGYGKDIMDAVWSTVYDCEVNEAQSCTFEVVDYRTED